ncbi:hypothetical protein GYMLUDRAFT_59437 [Collybiopsis luxurians FD-317 M1]|uniref:Uncharacterized protein n=1 Tax=Collybiopsis luxurians FD-317 M1 TaxID=944289 RepID=A0A0D0BX65_9AGAR|nr:hypothetical protein GYMLUDRAFT_59437 [Collybiopsis luxurians FD-317 M1]
MAIPPMKKSNACNINKAEEYQKEVQKAVDSKTSMTIIVLIDWKEIDSKLKSNKWHKNYGAYMFNVFMFNLEEHEIAQYCSMLEKKHENPYDSSYSFIDPDTGIKITLSSLMMKQWARAMYDEQATLTTPPNDDHFKAENCLPSIQPFACTAPILHGSWSFMNSIADSISVPSPSTDQTSDIGHLANILALVVSTAFHIEKSPPSEASAPPNILMSPNKLGITNATSYLYEFEQKRYGPDILDAVSDKDLMDIGVKPGDVICLKHNAPLWFNGPDAKHACIQPSQAASSTPSSSSKVVKNAKNLI